MLRRLWHDEGGQTLIEYILIGGLVAIGVIAVLITTSTAVRNRFQAIVNCLNSITTGGANC